MFTITFVILLMMTMALRLWLSFRHIRHVHQHRTQVPAFFSHKISLTAHQKAADYTIVKTRFAIFDALFQAMILISLTLLGGLEIFNHWAQTVFSHYFLQQVFLIGEVALFFFIIGLPFSFYQQFVIEERFGFNRMTKKLWFSDLLKSIAIGFMIGVPLILTILWLMQAAGQYWWLWAWLIWSCFNLLMIVLYPTFIAPLFNRFTPLTDTTLTSAIKQLAQRCGFTIDGLFVMDGSKRSGHGNAYFTGLGKNKRIVFFDTLLERLEVPEIEAVLAHELGHFKHRHITKRIFLSFILALGFFYVLGYLMNTSWFFTGLGVSPSLTTPNHGLALVLFALVMPVFTFFIQPLSSFYSRKFEYQADDFAAQHTQSSQLINALVKLYEDNAATLTPDPWYSRFYDSHPSAQMRIANLQLTPTS